MKTAPLRQTTHEGSSFMQKDKGWKQVKEREMRRTRRVSMRNIGKTRNAMDVARKAIQHCIAQTRKRMRVMMQVQL